MTPMILSLEFDCGKKYSYNTSAAASNELLFYCESGKKQRETEERARAHKSLQIYQWPNPISVY